MAKMRMMAVKRAKHVPVSDEQYLKLMDKSIASIEYSKKLENEGKVLFHGVAAGSSASYWIMEVDSAEEADLLLKGMPMYEHLDIDLYPLVSPTHVLKEIKEFVKSKGEKGGREGALGWKEE